ncbi:TetR/AcrR family transcriptional regulator [Jatrophihabitans sp. DSM 45814]
MSALPDRTHDPLSDVLFRPTSAGVVSSAVRAKAQELTRHAGAPPRPGNVMARSHDAILRGAARAVETSGSRISMSQVAAEAGVAKATLYNHFRTRDDVLRALLLDELDRIIAEISHLQLARALARAAATISGHPLLEALGARDSEMLAQLARVDVRSAGWLRVAEATDVLLARHGRRGGPTVLRWLSSFIVVPADDEDIYADVEVLIDGLPPLSPRSQG